MKKIKGLELIDKRQLQLVKQPKVNEGISNLPLRVYVRVVDFNKGVLKVEVDNQSGYPAKIGNGFGLNKIENRQYKEIVNVETTEEIEINDLEKLEMFIDLSTYKLTTGLYMLAVANERIDFELKK